MNMCSQARQKGATLIIALVMLLVLTLLAVAVMESSVVEERMAGNTLDRNITFQVAETAVRTAENIIDDWTNRPTPVNGVPGAGSASLLNSIGANPNSWWNEWDDADWRADGRPADVGDIEARYVIEEYDDVCDSADANPSLSDCKLAYRITAIAWGERNSTVMLQSIYSRRY